MCARSTEYRERRQQLEVDRSRRCHSEAGDFRERKMGMAVRHAREGFAPVRITIMGGGRTGDEAVMSQAMSPKNRDGQGKMGPVLSSSRSEARVPRKILMTCI